MFVAFHVIVFFNVLFDFTIVRATEIVPRSAVAAAPAAAVAAGGVKVSDLPKELQLHLQYQEHGVVANPLKSDDELCKEADERCSKGDHVGAEKCFACVLRRNPRHAKALCNFGYYLQNTKNDFEKAEAHYKRSLEVGSICRSLCFCYVVNTPIRLTATVLLLFAIMQH
jgi:tetratricopeptide (TPR) repeat protein